jgi:hypothetical protein
MKNWPPRKKTWPIYRLHNSVFQADKEEIRGQLETPHELRSFDNIEASRVVIAN